MSRNAPPPAEPSTPDSAASGDQLRGVMRRVASPVTVVTAAANGTLRGATIGSFTSVSLDPPLVSFNVQKASAFHGVLTRAEAFAVHLLGTDQADLATHFALPDIEGSAQFETVPHTRSPDGVPVLGGTSGVLHCAPWAVHDAGDHALVLGRVLRVEAGDAAGPLLYYDRSYRAVGKEV
ncbi:MAG: flavin reductase family protein [Bacteroidota bacterium]